MILLSLIVTPLLGGFLCLLLRQASLARILAMVAIGINFYVLLFNWFSTPTAKYRLEWVLDPGQNGGLGMHFGLDGMAFVLVALTHVMALVSLAFLWRQNLSGGFYLCLLSLLSGIIGVFSSLDLFVFFIFWEVMLVPLYFLIILYGNKHRIFAGTQFFVFTQASGLILLLGIIGIAVAYHRNTGVWSFDFEVLRQNTNWGAAGYWLCAAFIIAFLVKLAVVPFHTWLIDVFAEGPLAAIFLGILTKTGAYGLIRFALPLFPNEIGQMASTMMVLGIVTLIYGAVVALSQTDAKKLLAYATTSHMGLFLIGIFSQNGSAHAGVITLLVTQALSTAGLLMVATHLEQQRPYKRLSELGGIYQLAPKMGVIAWIFIMASVGLPGLGNFAGEFGLLLGSFASWPTITTIAATGAVLGAIYSLWFMQQIFFGKARTTADPFLDLPTSHLLLCSCLILALVWIGLYPLPLFETIGIAP